MIRIWEIVFKMLEARARDHGDYIPAACAHLSKEFEYLCCDDQDSVNKAEAYDRRKHGVGQNGSNGYQWREC